jgi:excisionase family DNA binding protein
MTKPVAVDKLLYTPVEAAHALGVGRSTIYVLMANGDVPSVRIGSSRRIPADGLRRYIASLSATGRVDAARGHGPKQQHLWD